MEGNVQCEHLLALVLVGSSKDLRPILSATPDQVKGCLSRGLRKKVLHKAIFECNSKLISVFKCDACLVCGCLELAHSNSLTFYLYNAGCLEEHKVLQVLGPSGV